MREVLKETGRASAICQCNGVVYYVIAALYMRSSYLEVLRGLWEGWQPPPTRHKASSWARLPRRLRAREIPDLPATFTWTEGPAATHMAEKRSKGAWYRQWKLVSLDGSTLDVEDTVENN